MLCACGQELGSTASYYWQTCTYDDKGNIIYAVCMHGIVCINQNIEIITHIETLEDLLISINNEIVGFEPCGREKNRIEAVKKAIEVLKEKIK